MNLKPAKGSDGRYPCFLLLLTASHGPVSAKSKVRVELDSILVDFGCCRVADVSQRLHFQRNKQLVLLVSKIDDNFLVTGECNIADSMLKSFDDDFNLGNVVHRPGTLQFFVFNVIRNDNTSCTTDKDEILLSL